MDRRQQVIHLIDDRLDSPAYLRHSPPDGSLELFMHFDLHLPAADVYHVFGYNDYQTNLVDWYPVHRSICPRAGLAVASSCECGRASGL